MDISKYNIILDELRNLYKAKNSDYGDSFSKIFEKYGLLSSVIRLEDKINRLSAFTKRYRVDVVNESIRDTLLDLANYSILTAMELDKVQIVSKIEHIPPSRIEITPNGDILYKKDE